MAEIRLENVTRLFQPTNALGFRQSRGRGLPTDQADRAFSERAMAQARQEAEIRSGAAEDIKALDGVNLTIPNGQTFAVVGPSGCGKSTLLRVVAGLDTAYTGQVYYDGQDMADVPPKDRYIGMVFQNYALYPHFEGEGNLRFFFKVRKAPDAEADERIRATSEMMGFGFAQLLERRPGTLSGGQQQRLAIGRALVRNPRLFLFDEPLSNLDAKLRTQTRIEIKRLLRRFQITAIYVTHDQVEAMALADQVAIMREGKIAQVGPYDELHDRPANVFVAGFLGSHPMNLLTGTVLPDGVLGMEGVSVPLPESIRARIAPGQQITFGVRPEAARLMPPARREPGDAYLIGEVDTMEPDFGHHVQYIRVQHGATVVTVMLDIEQGWRAGETMEVVFPPDALYFFDPETGQSLAK